MLELKRRFIGSRESRSSVLAIALIVAFGVVLVGLHVRDYTRLSPIDELQHLDYVNRVVREGEVVRRGDHFRQDAMRTEACQGLDATFPVPPCGLDRYDPATFQEEGFNTAYINPPVYYAISGYTALGISTVIGSDSLFTAGRFTGAFWLGAALLLLWLAMSELRIHWRVRVPILVLLMTAPTVLEAVATINPDATALFAGAAVLLAVLRWERTGRVGWPALASAVALMLKSTNILAVGMGLIYILIRYLQRSRAAGEGDAMDDAGPAEPRPSLPPILGVSAAMVAAVATVSVVWLVIGSAIARVPIGEIPMQARFHVDSIGITAFLSNLTTGFTPLDSPYIPAELMTAWISPTSVIVDRLFLVGLGTAAFTARPGSQLRAIALASLIALALVGPGFVLVNYLLIDGVYVTIPRRYGVSVMPGVAIALSVLLRDRRILAAVSGFAMVLALLTARALLG